MSQVLIANPNWPTCSSPRSWTESSRRWGMDSGFGPLGSCNQAQPSALAAPPKHTKPWGNCLQELVKRCMSCLRAGAILLYFHWLATSACSLAKQFLATPPPLLWPCRASLCTLLRHANPSWLMMARQCRKPSTQ